MVLATIIERLPKSRWSVLLPGPETILRGHRELVRRKWAAFGKRPRRVRPAMDPEVVDVILRLARETRGGDIVGSRASCSSWDARVLTCSLPLASGSATTGMGGRVPL